MLIGEWLNVFSLILERRWVCLLLPFLFYYIGGSSQGSRQKKEIKDIQTRKKGVKLYSFTGNMIIYLLEPAKMLEQISDFFYQRGKSQVQHWKINYMYAGQ